MDRRSVFRGIAAAALGAPAIAAAAANTAVRSFEKQLEAGDRSSQGEREFEAVRVTNPRYPNQYIIVQRRI